MFILLYFCAPSHLHAHIDPLPLTSRNKKTNIFVVVSGANVYQLFPGKPPASAKRGRGSFHVDKETGPTNHESLSMFLHPPSTKTKTQSAYQSIRHIGRTNSDCTEVTNIWLFLPRRWPFPFLIGTSASRVRLRAAASKIWRWFLEPTAARTISSTAKMAQGPNSRRARTTTFAPTLKKSTPWMSFPTSSRTAITRSSFR